MKTIKLTQNQVTIVDNDDFEYLNQFKWCAQWNPGTRSFYAVRCSYKRETGKQKAIPMHREIMQPSAGMVVDHINHDTLDNTRKNLRVCTQSENLMNSRKQKNNTSGLKGVSWHKRDKKWRADISINGKRKHLGNFSTKEFAYESYIKACKKYHKEFANY